MYARVAVDIVHRHLDQLFDYEIPQGMSLRPGSKVSIPFRNRVVDGFVFETSEITDQRSVKMLKAPKAGVLESSPEMPDLACWLAARYLCLKAEAAKLMFPSGNIPLAPGIRATQRLLEDPQGARLELKRSPARLRLLDWLLSHEMASALPLRAALESGAGNESTVASLVKAGFIERAYVLRKPQVEESRSKVSEHKLTAHQKKALEEISKVQQSGGEVLLHGITGSGKTEVYIRALKEAVANGRQGILLVPDIALTPQMSDIVRSHFGSRVAVLHSGLTDSERAYHWYMASRGQVDVVVGARSAVFAPLMKLGIIIIDEEHDGSYKQEDSPRYHAREVARKRAELCKAALVLGTATPSLETYARASEGQIGLCELPERVDGRKLPEIVLIDRREEMRHGNYSFLSRRLKSEMDLALQKGGRILLFLNRRGHSPLVLCRDCGYTMQCPGCDVSLVYHSDAKVARCHYCQHEEAVPARCPKCASARLKLYGFGTQKVEEELRKLFPGTGIGRMDVDSTRKRGSHRGILEAFRDGRTPILVGTQMIAKGLDIPEVTLVGVLAADMSLKFPDFRAAERTYQLVAQVSGRAGRGTEPGLVVVQSYNPDHYSLKAAQAGDYRAFFNREAASRRALGYPPYSHMARVLVVSESDASASDAAEVIAGRILEEPSGLRLLGPSPAPISRVEGRSRWHILLLGDDEGELVDKLSFIAREDPPEGCSVRLDFDPQSTM